MFASQNDPDRLPAPHVQKLKQQAGEEKGNPKLAMPTHPAQQQMLTTAPAVATATTMSAPQPATATEPRKPSPQPQQPERSAVQSRHEPFSNSIPVSKVQPFSRFEAKSASTRHRRCPSPQYNPRAESSWMVK